ncbi:DUF3021 domain-containing protein [Geomicrobium sp. JCM 19055]|uniref:DUF3021 domain-containing protein n=1 Tax=Geomicrobium sp. JCM 19055 TaxID=1460649 RepID=UPI00045ED2D8|nr:DUF3021 domain-containing protein [Geomicrobium sp. JCM 19055]GAJ97476.1 hypothetical protein JCM19055_338 [Geomicrobium sp. JCM 19055]
MIRELFFRILAGIAAGGFIMFIALTILMINDINPSSHYLWTQMLGSILMGIYFAISALIFENDSMSLLSATAIHYALSIVVWFTIAYAVGWFPFSMTAVAIAISTFTILYCIHWFCFYLYYKRMENKLNQSLKKQG